MKKSSLQKICNFPTNSKNSEFQKQIFGFVRFFLELVASSMLSIFLDSTLGGAVTFNSWWTMWRLHISMAFRWIGEAFRKLVMLGSWPARVRLLAASAWFFSEGQVFRSDGSDTRFGSHVLKVRYSGRFQEEAWLYVYIWFKNLLDAIQKNVFFWADHILLIGIAIIS